jgi:hypothetical protein
MYITLHRQGLYKTDPSSGQVGGPITNKTACLDYNQNLVMSPVGDPTPRLTD